MHWKDDCPCIRCVLILILLSVTSHTISGSCGVKVWIYRGDILSDKEGVQAVRQSHVDTKDIKDHVATKNKISKSF